GRHQRARSGSRHRRRVTRHERQSGNAVVLSHLGTRSAIGNQQATQSNTAGPSPRPLDSPRLRIAKRRNRRVYECPFSSRTTFATLTDLAAPANPALSDRPLRSPSSEKVTPPRPHRSSPD